LKIRREQCRASHKKICGQAVKVPVPESEGADRIGRFGWKDQHASLLAFAADAYLNEMGITNSLQKAEVTTICNPPVTTTIPNNDPTKITEPNSLPDPNDNNLEDIDHFASFMRSLKAPARDQVAAATPDAKHGAELFTKIGCTTCHVDTIVTGKSPASPGGPGLHSDAVENRTIHPYSDFLMHNVGTGDGIAVAVIEHYGRRMMTFAATNREYSQENFQSTRNRLRTPPLWGVRMRPRLMHDGESTTLTDAIRRHRGEADEVKDKFQRLPPADRAAILDFLRSL